MKLKNLELNYDKLNFLSINSFLFFFILIIDRVTKDLALKNYFAQFNNSFLFFAIEINRGVSWGMFHSENDNGFFLVSFIVLIIIGILLFHIKLKIKENKSILGEIFILSGAISNFIDRICYNGVIDFIIISFNGLSWPAFNIADMSIVFGALILLIELL